MKLNRKHLQFKAFAALALILCFFSACQPDFDNVVPDAAEVNYFAASDYLTAQGVTEPSPYFRVYVDTDNYPYKANTQFPYFIYSPYGDGVSEYPTINATGRPGEKAALYQSIPVGGHTFFFHGDGISELVTTKQLELEGNSRTLLYLIDAPAEGTTPVWDVIPVPERTEALDAAKTTVRFLNLSPDAGELTLRFKNPDGSYAPEAQTAAAYPQYTAYLAVDPTALANKSQLRFDITDATGAVALTGYVSATPGAVYHIIARGFTQEQQIDIPYERTEQGEITTKTYTVSPLLRVSTRRIY